MRKKKLTVLGALVTVLLVGFASSSFSAVLAKNVNVPEGETIFYFSGGNTTISVPATFHWPTAKLGILATDNIGGNAGTGESLVLTLTITMSGVPTTFPWAFITTNPVAAEVQRASFSGTPVYIHKTNSGGVMQTLDNIFPVTDEELKVERHGNSITVDFTPLSPITLQFPNTPFWPRNYVMTNPNPPPATSTIPPVLYPLVLPAFHLELEKYGGSIHFTSSRTFTTTLPGVVFSGYTLTMEHMGFYADATFTCPTWPAPVNMQTAHDAFVTMHGITTVIPPPPA